MPGKPSAAAYKAARELIAAIWAEVLGAATSEEGCQDRSSEGILVDRLAAALEPEQKLSAELDRLKEHVEELRDVLGTYRHGCASLMDESKELRAEMKRLREARVVFYSKATCELHLYRGICGHYWDSGEECPVCQEQDRLRAEAERLKAQENLPAENKRLAERLGAYLAQTAREQNNILFLFDALRVEVERLRAENDRLPALALAALKVIRKWHVAWWPLCATCGRTEADHWREYYEQEPEMELFRAVLGPKVPEETSR